MGNKQPEFFHSAEESLSPDEELDSLRREVSLYRSLLEAAPEGVAIVDTETGKFRYANTALCTMLDYTMEEFLAMGIDTIIPSKMLPTIMGEFPKKIAVGDKIRTVGIPCERKDGGIVLADVNSTTSALDGEKCRICFFECEFQTIPTTHSI